MALLPILEFPDPRLRKVAEPVTEVTDSIRQLTDDMLETMYAAPGIGLAATQVDVHQRIVVIDVSEEGDEPLVLINPEWEALDEDMQVYQEGCLSVPEFYDDIDRHSHIVYRALDRDGQAIESQASDLLAICIQHELDHLNGKLFVDYLSSLKRNILIKKVTKLKKMGEI